MVSYHLHSFFAWLAERAKYFYFVKVGYRDDWAL